MGVGAPPSNMPRNEPAATKLPPPLRVDGTAGTGAGRSSMFSTESDTLHCSVDVNCSMEVAGVVAACGACAWPFLCVAGGCTGGTKSCGNEGWCEIRPAKPNDFRFGIVLWLSVAAASCDVVLVFTGWAADPIVASPHATPEFDDCLPSLC